MCFSVQKHAFLSIKAMLLSSKSIEFINREKQQKMQHAGYQHVAFLLIFALFPAKNFFVENNAKEMLNRNVKMAWNHCASQKKSVPARLSRARQGLSIDASSLLAN